MENNNQNSNSGIWIVLVTIAVLFVSPVLLLKFNPTGNTKPVILPMPTITYKKTATSTETNEYETFFKAIENAPEDSYMYINFPSKPETVYVMGEREDCKKQGGEFSLDSTTNGELDREKQFFAIGEVVRGHKMTCIKTTIEGNRTIIEKIFDYQINN